MSVSSSTFPRTPAQWAGTPNRAPSCCIALRGFRGTLQEREFAVHNFVACAGQVGCGLLGMGPSRLRHDALVRLAHDFFVHQLGGGSLLG
jgi:hypothetical protein